MATKVENWVKRTVNENYFGALSKTRLEIRLIDMVCEKFNLRVGQRIPPEYDRAIMEYVNNM